MPEKIQRVPRALSNLLSLQSGQTPIELEDRVRGTLDLLQMYGLNQLQFATASDAALAEGAATMFVTPSPTAWTVLFMASMQITKTATMTALRAAVSVSRVAGNIHRLAEQELGPFGATETGVVTVAFVSSYPLLLPPGTTITGSLAILGTDATANCGVRAEFGLLG